MAQTTAASKVEGALRGGQVEQQELTGEPGFQRMKATRELLSAMRRAFAAACSQLPPVVLVGNQTRT